jgi:hypothetical protein
MDSRGLHMHIDSAAGFLLTVGMVQGLFEMAFALESDDDGLLSSEGDLDIEVRPKSSMMSVKELS